MAEPKWSVHEWQSCYTVRDEYGRMVCRCSLTAYGKKYAELIAKLPELLKRAKENESTTHNS